MSLSCLCFPYSTNMSKSHTSVTCRILISLSLAEFPISLQHVYIPYPYLVSNPHIHVSCQHLIPLLHVDFPYSCHIPRSHISATHFSLTYNKWNPHIPSNICFLNPCHMQVSRALAYVDIVIRTVLQFMWRCFFTGQKTRYCSRLY